MWRACKFFFNQLCVTIHIFTSSRALLAVTPFQKIHFAKCCVTLLYLCGDGRQRPLQKLTLSEPGCPCRTHTHRHTQCAVGLAVQPNLNESVAVWYDLYRWPFGTGMTKQWPQQVSLLQIMKWQSHRWRLNWLHHMLLLKNICCTVYARKACNYDQANSHKLYILWMS